MEVIHNYLQQLLRRKLPFARQNAVEKFKIKDCDAKCVD
jgi:hypothetical protein